MVRVTERAGGLAKISPPMRAKVLERPRLFGLLDRQGPRRVLWPTPVPPRTPPGLTRMATAASTP